MTQLRIPARPGGWATIRLVYLDAPRGCAVGFNAHEWADDCWSMPLDTEQVVSLTPSAAVATATGRATGYLVAITGACSQRWEGIIEIPDSADVQELDTLISAARVAPEAMRNIFLGGVLCEIVESVPDPYVPGVLYFSKT